MARHFWKVLIEGGGEKEFIDFAIHTAVVEDESNGWQAPTTRLVGNDGKWEFVGGIHPTFDRREYWEDDSDDDDVTDLTDGAQVETVLWHPGSDPFDLKNTRSTNYIVRLWVIKQTSNRFEP